MGMGACQLQAVETGEVFVPVIGSRVGLEAQPSFLSLYRKVLY